ncbi:MAG: hypothetical protein ACHQ7M_03460 [Chloroflexota bacterium]
MSRRWMRQRPARRRGIAVSALFAVVMGLLGGMLGGWLASEDFGAGRAS